MITISGNVLGTTTNADLYAPATKITLAGPGTASAPQLLEVMGIDLGSTAAGFNRNFNYSGLELTQTYVRLVDNARRWHRLKYPAYSALSRT